MYPIFSEEYILSKESYFGFTVDQNKKSLDKNKRTLKLMSYFQVGVGTVFIVAMLLSGQKISFIMLLLAAMMIVTGLTGSSRSKGYDKKVQQSLESSYATRNYGENLFRVKFYEDKLEYSVGEQADRLSYDDFAKVYDGESYFAVHFFTGEVIIFNRSCNIERIRELLTGYRAEHPKSEIEATAQKRSDYYTGVDDEILEDSEEQDVIELAATDVVIHEEQASDEEQAEQGQGEEE